MTRTTSAIDPEASHRLLKAVRHITDIERAVLNLDPTATKPSAQLALLAAQRLREYLAAQPPALLTRSKGSVQRALDAVWDVGFESARDAAKDMVRGREPTLPHSDSPEWTAFRQGVNAMRASVLDGLSSLEVPS